MWKIKNEMWKIKNGTCKCKVWSTTDLKLGHKGSVYNEGRVTEGKL